jgi:hypothetical protein
VSARNDRDAAGPLPVPETVRLAELKDAPAFSEAGRDPFSFGARPAPPAPIARPAESAAPPAPVIPPPPPGPPPIALRLIGITVPPGAQPMVTLKDPVSGVSFDALEGQIVDGRYRVIKVGERSVVLSYVDGTGMRTITLGG